MRVRVLDFHAEATSEKQLMGRHLDGRVGTVLGTHTHVPTADEQILPHGTAFQCDVGMTGPCEKQTRARYPDVQGFLERDGVRIFYEVYGAGDPTIMLLPTWEVVHSRAWKLQIPFLARHGRVVTFDRRGNGRSDRPAEVHAYDRRETVADAIAVLDAAQVDTALVVSWGWR